MLRHSRRAALAFRFSRAIPLARHSAYVPLPEKLAVGATLLYPHNGRARVVLPGEQDAESKGLKIAVVGASGSVGRQIAMSVASKRRHFAGQGPVTLQFVGRRDRHSLSILIGLCSELRDAFAEYCPNLEIVEDIEAVKAHIIVMAAGATLSTQYKTHKDLVRANADLFGEYASGLVERNRNALVMVVSNPVEFGVDSFIKAGFARDRVLGTGSFIDSMRFQREIAAQIGVPQQQVTGLVIGVHGLGMVPCWSTVRLAALNASQETIDALEKLKEEGLARGWDVTAMRKQAYTIREMALRGDALAALSLVNRQPPDSRAALRRYLSFFAGPVYPRIGIGEGVCSMIMKILSGRDSITAAQFAVNGEFFGIKNAIGVPVVVSGNGVRLAQSVKLTPVEIEGLKAAAEEAKSIHFAAEASQLFQKLVKRKDRKSSQ